MITLPTWIIAASWILAPVLACATVVLTAVAARRQARRVIEETDPRPVPRQRESEE